jgi:hypothetical protein
MAMVFFAGHGIQRSDENWLVPVDAALAGAGDVSARLVPLAQVMQAAGRAAQGVVILDACRDDPLAAAGQAPAPGLAQMRATEAGKLVAFATSPGRVALDGTGQHSPFADALLDHLGAPGLDLRQVLTRVRRQVLLATEGQQVPWDTSSLTADLTLRAAGLPHLTRAAAEAPAAAARPGAARPATPPRPAPPPAAPAAVAFDPRRYREIPLAYARARAAGHLFPDGLLVQRRNAEGQETPICGAYSWADDISFWIVLSADERRKTAEVISSGSALRPAGFAAWSQFTVRFDGGVMTNVINGTVVTQADFNTGWATLLARRDRAGNLLRPLQSRIVRVE